MAPNPAELPKHKNLRTPARAAVTSLVTKLDALLRGNPVDTEALEENLALLERKHLALSNIEQKIMEILTEADDLVAEQAKIDEYEDKVTLIKCKVNRKLKEIDQKKTNGNGSNPGQTTNTGQSTSTSISASTSLLPTLTIPKFGGEVTEWANFWSRFETTIDKNQQLKKVDKFCYLASNLVGIAKEIVDGFHASDQSYDDSVKLLKSRFGRDDLVQHAHMKKLLDIEHVFDSNNTSALRRLYNACEVNIRSLKTLGVDIKVSGFSLCPAIIKKLPSDIRLSFSLTRKANDPWDVEKLVDFLKDQIEGRETSALLGDSEIEPSRKEKGYKTQLNKHPKYDNENKNIASIAALNTWVKEDTGFTIFCIFCDEKNTHKSVDCVKFSVDEKRKKIYDQARCFLCLKKSHSTKNCDSRYRQCKICKGKHNSCVCYRNPANKREDKGSENRGSENRGSENRGSTSVNSIISDDNSRREVLLQTAKALALEPGDKNTGQQIRCLFDNGSQATFIEEEIS